MKRIISVYCAVLMLTSVFSVAASAGGEIYEAMPFTDLKEGAWYMEGIEFCYYTGLVSGMTDTKFMPNGTLTRAQFVQILAMFAGADLEAYEEYDIGFNDVKTKHWFYAPVCWAVDQGFVSGLSATKFGPNKPITREQLARLLYLYGEAQGLDMEPRADLSGYTDESKVSYWAYDQVQWAVAADIISGTSETTLSHRATATRAQACRMMMKFDEYTIYGIRITDGVYRAIAEYVTENGTVDPDDPDYYDITVETDGKFCSVVYNVAEDTILFAYMSEPYEDTEGLLYREIAMIEVNSLSSVYAMSYMYDDGSEENYIYSIAVLSGKGTCVLFEDQYGYDEETASARADAALQALSELISNTVTELGYGTEDFYLPSDKETTVGADAIADLVMSKGADGYANGWYTYNVTVDEKEYVIDYSPVLESMTISYPSYGIDYSENEYYESVVIYLSNPTVCLDYVYDCFDETLGYVYAEGIITVDGYAETTFYTESDEDAARDLEAEARSGIAAALESVLAECGLTFEDMFEVVI